MIYRNIFNNTGSCLILLLSAVLLSCTSSEELEWVDKEGYKWAKLSSGYFGSPGFSKVDSATTNIRFINYASNESIAENRNFLNGSGVATVDVDGDGKTDVYLANLEGANKLYKNLGDMQFEDITMQAGVAHEGYQSTGVVFSDVDGDGDPDLLIASLFGEIQLYKNDGTGHFELEHQSGLGKAKGSNTLALADIDGDGDLDLYVSNFKLKSARDIYSADELATENTIRKQGDSLVVIPPYDQHYGIIETDGRSYRNEYGARDDLYINDGDGRFIKTDHSQRFFDEKGKAIGLARDWGLAAKFQDINGDQLPDLYVANDFWTPDRIWINKGEGRFQSIKPQAIRNMSLAAMGVDFSDINRDGAVDIFVTEMLSNDHRRHKSQLTDYLDPIDGRPQYNRNSLYLNRGDHTFAEISSFAGLEATEWSWATEFLDIDLDGYEDLLITTGNQYDYLDLDTQLEMNQRSAMQSGYMGNILEYPSLRVANKIYRNDKDLTFEDKSSSWGFTEKDISMGLAVADLDNDGDGDLILNRLNEQAAIYENTTTAPRIAVQLQGASPNTAGIGAKVELRGGSVRQQKEVSAGGTYVSGSSKRLYFAADEGSDHTIRVTWRDGTVSRIDSVRANGLYAIQQTETASPMAAEEQENHQSWFQDISEQLAHSHSEESYNDFNVQPLLPLRVSQQGPGISWIDFNQDGKDDLFISAGKGHRAGIYKNMGEGKFESATVANLNEIAVGDQTTILGWKERGQMKVIVGSANFEQGDPEVPAAYLYEIGEFGQSVGELPGQLSTTGPLAMADYDGDGHLDLFVGGSFIPGGYPKDATSRLFKSEGGQFTLDKVNASALQETGMVNSGIFTDYDQDGDQDLILSRPWNTLAVLNNEDGTFTNVTHEVGLDQYHGWWNGIATGDFNNDGLPDIVATNIGKNSIYQPDDGYPLRLYYSDFDMNGTIDIIDAYFDKDLQSYVPRRKLYEYDSIPSILSSVGSHSAYAGSSVDQIFRQDFKGVPFKKLNTTEHMLFINNGEGFEAYPLPDVSQLTAAFAVVVADFNNDGNEDLFLSQNLFDLPPGIPRLDAGRGLLLTGDGTGNLEPISGQDSGIIVYGQQRGASASDINRDGKMDLAVAQNQDRIKLYLNRTEKAGLRVTLDGPVPNELAIGSSIQILYSNGEKGPVREIQAGSGYWSQQSSTQVLGVAGDAEALEVTWFDGHREVMAVDKQQMEYVLTY